MRATLRWWTGRSGTPTAPRSGQPLARQRVQTPLQINVGFVALATQRGLVELFDVALEDLRDSGDIEAAFSRLGYRYNALVEPVVLPPLTWRLLAPAADGS